MRSTDTKTVAAAGAIALIAGLAVLALAGGIAAIVAASALLGLAGIAFVSLAFLVIGEGEERDRERHPRG